jgi:hypothetical protein
MGFSLSIPGLSIHEGRRGMSVDTPLFSYSERNYDRGGYRDYGGYRGGGPCLDGFSRRGWNDGFRSPGNCFPGGGMRQTGPGIPSNYPRYLGGNGFNRGGMNDPIGLTRAPGQGVVGMGRNGEVISSRNGELGSVGGMGEAYDRCGNFVGGGAPDGTILDQCNQPIGYVAESGHVYNRCNDIVGQLDIPGGMRGEHAAAYARLAFGNQLG